MCWRWNRWRPCASNWAAALPGVQALAGSAQAMPLPDNCAQALVCAQAFHWFASEDALREMQRVLAPGGQLGLVWNVRDEALDWVAAITEIITPHEGDAPRFYKGDWRRPFAGASGSHLFSPLELTSFSYLHVGSAQQVILDRFLSVSFIAALPADQKGRRGAPAADPGGHAPCLARPGQHCLPLPHRSLPLPLAEVRLPLRRAPEFPPGRPKGICGPEGLKPAAHSLPAQAGTG